MTEADRIAQVQRLRSEITWLQRWLAERNRQIDAMGWVWSVTSKRGVFRFGVPDLPLPPDEGLVQVMQANVDKVRRLVRARRFPAFWASLDAEARARYHTMVQSERDAWFDRWARPRIAEEEDERAAAQIAAALEAAAAGRTSEFAYHGEARCPFCEGGAYIVCRPNPERVPDEPGDISVQWFLACSCCACEGPWARSRAVAIKAWEFRPAPVERARLCALCGVLRAFVGSLPPALAQRLMPILDEWEEMP